MPLEITQERKPFIYQTEVPIRYSDVDRYNHVGTASYFDYLFTSRFEYAQRQFGVTPDDLYKRGIGFFVAEIQMKFALPIGADQRSVTVTSHVPTIDRARFPIEFAIHSDLGQHANGTLNMRIIDLKTGKPMNAPDWVLDLLFEPEEQLDQNRIQVGSAVN